jgi:hypothetical protein
MKKSPAPEQFKDLLESLVRRYGTRDALGRTIQMSGSRVGRAIDGQYTFNIENCLKLAAATGESPSAVLRAAGKGEVAALIERLYGDKRPMMGASDRELMERWNLLDPNEKASIKGIVWKLTKDRAGKRVKRTA